MRDETILVVDLEATCWEDQTTPAGDAQSVNNMEIIEVGCALATRKGSLQVDDQEGRAISTFKPMSHFWGRPKTNVPFL